MSARSGVFVSVGKLGRSVVSLKIQEFQVVVSIVQDCRGIRAAKPE